MAGDERTLRPNWGFQAVSIQQGTQNNAMMAYHQAGHAVVAILLGVRPAHVALRYEEETKDHVQLRIDSDVPAQERMVIAFAGPAASMRFGIRHEAADRSDRERVMALALASVGRPGRSADSLLKIALQRAQELVRVQRHWAAIDALAQALLDVDVISTDDVIAVIEQAMQLRHGIIDAAERFIRGESIHFQDVEEG